MRATWFQRDEKRRSTRIRRLLQTAKCLDLRVWGSCFLMPPFRHHPPSLHDDCAYGGIRRSEADSPCCLAQREAHVFHIVSGTHRPFLCAHLSTRKHPPSDIRCEHYAFKCIGFSERNAAQLHREAPFPTDMKNARLTEKQIDAYHRDGFLIARRLFDREEISLLSRTAREDRVLDQHSFSRDDGTGASVRLSLWNHPGDGIYGMFARCRKLVDAVEQLLGDEAYHYHSKMIMKDARVGGAWAWHQDYGYWYENGVLAPDLCSVSIAVDAATRENGCMQVLKGSHRLGRVNHVLTGDQAGADMERVDEAMKRHDLIHCVMKQGDALFFHANLLHASARNDSEHPRWSMICCYNARSNDPYQDGQHPRYTPLKKVADAKVRQVGMKRFADDQTDVAWLDSGKDTTAKGLKRISKS